MLSQMKNKIEYEPEGQVVLNGMNWNWDTLKELCFHDFVYEGRPRGIICNKYKLPREIMNEWITIEDWDTAKKSHWQRPYSYRIDFDLANLLQNIQKLTEIQKEVKDIDFQSDNLLSRITINVDINDNNQLKSFKTIIIEKYRIIIEGEEDDYGEVIFDESEEMRYKVELNSEKTKVKFSKVVRNKSLKNRIN